MSNVSFWILAACVLAAAADAQTARCEKKSGTVEGGICDGMEYNVKVCRFGGGSESVWKNKVIGVCSVV